MPVRRPAEHQRDGLEDQAEVLPERPVRDVEVVEPDHLLERDVAAAEHLPEAGDARLQLEALARPVVDVLVLLEDQRPRADEAHLAAEDVEQLRQLVERVAAQEAADRVTRGSSGILNIRASPPARVLVQVRELVLPLLGVGDHRPELEDPERLSALRPCAAGGRRPGRGESSLISSATHGEERRRADQPEAGDDDVDRALEQRSTTGRGEAAAGRAAEALDEWTAIVRGAIIEQARDDVDLDAPSR